MTRFHTTEKIGPKRRLTPEGYLVCQDVPIARTGIMLYDASEMPADAIHARNVPEGHPVQVMRTEDEVFSPDTIASANGKAVVNEHPTEDVGPRNHRDLAVGHMQNPRRGDPPDDDLLIADMVITDPDAIADILAGKREVSCGYDADYFDDPEMPGWAEQRNISMNHLALVHEGRCGQRCAIGDQKTETAMTRNPWTRFLDRVRRAAKDEDLSRLEEALKDEMPDAAEEGGDHTHIHIHGAKADVDKPEDHKVEDDEEAGTGGGANGAVMAKLNELCDLLKQHLGGNGNGDSKAGGWPKDKKGRDQEEKEGKEEEAATAADERAFEMEAPPGTEDRARKARDSSYLVDAFQRSVSGAEILAPGIRIPTFDSAYPIMDGYKKLCNLRRAALDQGYARSDTRDLIEEANGGRTLDIGRMSCDAVRAVFMASVALKKADSGRRHIGGSVGSTGGGSGVVGQVRSLAELNKLNAEFYR